MTNTEAGNSATPAFNLLDERWLPVRFCDGRLTEVGLLELFQSSRDIEGLAEPSPPSFVALHRLLLAITHRALTRALGRWTTAQRARWCDQGLPVQAIVDYLEHWRERFWVLHPTMPFMQVAALAGSLPPKADKRFGSAVETLLPGEPLTPKPWTQVSLECAAGNNAVVFDHSLDAQPTTIPVGLAVRLLLGYLQFAPGQPVKALCKSGNDLSGPLFNTACTVPVAARLCETLSLSLPPAGSAQAGPSEDLASWERDPPAVADLLGDATPSRGPCDSFTRLTRATLLIKAPAGGVSNLLFAEGLALKDDPLLADPMASYRPGSKEWVRLTFNEGRAFWRDLGALLPDTTGKAARPAPILDWAAACLAAQDSEEELLEFYVAGIAADQAKMLRGRLQRFRLPSGTLGADACAQLVRSQLARAEQHHRGLRHAAERLLAETMPGANSLETAKRARAVVSAGPLTATFFSLAELGLAGLLTQLAAGQLEAAHEQWTLVLTRAADAAWREQIRVLGAGPRALRAVAIASGGFVHLQRTLADALGTQVDPVQSLEVQEVP